ncbi:hypothetical protein EDC45_1174 [Mesocricetibacter intestinalis]|uniref:UPF0149 protein EDC45_1174 n=1 Tax=Mesocricetibacter intestinalis TaxID=1521930 RepID=A0A4R6V8R6_9PAST|nr:YecA family protein [Mesocricetibacter intestinalis]TDQ58102.1 hypothetical protein EDC45_1174 [Mesocricetibacter intestinalis]
MTSYLTFNQQLQGAGISLSAAELHGFISGLVCGGIEDQSWLSLVYQFTNDNHAYPTALLTRTEALYRQIKEQLADMDSFAFELWLPEEEDVFVRADGLSAWANHFLLGLGLAQPKLELEKGEIGEAIEDLHEICRLGYSEEDDPEELMQALEEIIEYVRTIAALFYTHFRPLKSASKPVLH